MSDDWEDEDVAITVLSIPNKEQSKRLEERRLVEECDNSLTEYLFSNHEKNATLKQFQPINKNIIKIKKNTKKNKSNKHEVNELKQKELSKKIRAEKLRREKEKEIFGEAEEYDEYTKYDDMFY
jgi:flagellar biosynthesis GTPase FlhF